ncbi:hypothetical protein GGTG_04484 [Gaeumannomyces tritici R3-111a-1]|uniref:Uncharacterized protein n=1 Tax=Gaeumannomyces tritici (strain R3-111a-1) TaxID=644352 RepID=J3NT85_GAET3|nr:hypothetical protein GGTG_04484 [Gaeumannomyces tritici R3-111a-1]EJT79400.1 hypothetical protein GGTG_04484 [Gaeumannomyces tritici R3-111a-1]
MAERLVNFDSLLDRFDECVSDVGSKAESLLHANSAETRALVKFYDPARPGATWWGKAGRWRSKALQGLRSNKQDYYKGVSLFSTAPGISKMYVNAVLARVDAQHQALTSKIACSNMRVVKEAAQLKMQCVENPNTMEERAQKRAKARRIHMIKNGDGDLLAQLISPEEFQKLLKESEESEESEETSK